MNDTTNTATKTIKPSTLFRTMAQASPKGAKELFIIHAADIAQHYTSVKQLVNDVTATSEQWGLNRVFAHVLKACKTAKTPGEAFESATIALLDYDAKPKKAKPAKPALDFVDILGALPTLSRDDLAQLMREASLLAEHGAATVPATPAKQAPAPLPALH